MPQHTPSTEVRRRATNLRVTCPHCDAPAAGRSSERLTPVLREIYYQCTNLLCGHAFVATHEIVRTVTPSQIPNPAVRLPTLARGSHRPFYTGDPPANDSRPPPANDEQVPKPSTG